MYRTLPVRGLRLRPTHTTISIQRTIPRTFTQFLCHKSTDTGAPNSIPVDLSSGLAPSRLVRPTSASTTMLPPAVELKQSLPATCSGCGAFTQMESPKHPGYFGLERRAVREYLGLEEKRGERKKKAEEIKENHQVLAVINQIGEEKLKQLGIDPKSLILEENPNLELTNQHDQSRKPPLCDRCHVLTHHHMGQSIFHPSIHSIAATIEETPWKYNHVLHVIDAADFPMSLVPRLHELIGDIYIRSQNRRSTAHLFRKDRSITMSFVITRADLLAPKKEQVDSIVPYLREVLREALGKSGRSVRLGNLWCVSAKRSWWVKELKEEVWKRGGASWLVGKINVGKSQLFEAIYPKGRVPAEITEAVREEKEKEMKAAETEVAQATEALLDSSLKIQETELLEVGVGEPIITETPTKGPSLAESAVAQALETPSALPSTPKTQETETAEVAKDQVTSIQTNPEVSSSETDTVESASVESTLTQAVEASTNSTSASEAQETGSTSTAADQTTDIEITTDTENITDIAAKDTLTPESVPSEYTSANSVQVRFTLFELAQSSAAEVSDETTLISTPQTQNTDTTEVPADEAIVAETAADSSLTESASVESSPVESTPAQTMEAPTDFVFIPQESKTEPQEAAVDQGAITKAASEDSSTESPLNGSPSAHIEDSADVTPEIQESESVEAVTDPVVTTEATAEVSPFTDPSKTELPPIESPTDSIPMQVTEIPSDPTPISTLETLETTPVPKSRTPLIEDVNPLSIGSWLPPPRKPEPYPVMPIVSPLAGTTASPIRIPFGNNRGELIDMPGISRSSLFSKVMTKYRDQLVMTSRIVPEQVTIKPGQSLLIGGMFRITPRDPYATVLAYNFTPMKEHVTRTEKAVEISEQKSQLLVGTIAMPGIGEQIRHAVSVKLRHDVTKERAGPLTRKNAVGLKVRDLPFRVLATDILIESVGWVEVVVQVRTRHLYNGAPAEIYEERQQRLAERRREIEDEGAIIKRDKKETYPSKTYGNNKWHKEFEQKSEDPWTILKAVSKEDLLKFTKPETPKTSKKPTSVWDELEQELMPKVNEVKLDDVYGDLPEPQWPIIDIYSPEGKYIGFRKSMNGWLLNKPLVKDEHRRGRPRKSMKGEKKMMKMLRRQERQREKQYIQVMGRETEKQGQSQ